MGFLCQDSIEELFLWLVHMIWLSFKDSNVLEADKIQENAIRSCLSKQTQFNVFSKPLKSLSLPPPI